MSIPLRVIETGGTWPDEHQPGDMWRWPPGDADGRECWSVALPNGTVWHTTQTAGSPRTMWDVSGNAPDITVSPSIFDHSATEWHGWIRNGELVPA